MVRQGSRLTVNARFRGAALCAVGAELYAAGFVLFALTLCGCTVSEDATTASGTARQAEVLDSAEALDRLLASRRIAALHDRAEGPGTDCTRTTIGDTDKRVSRFAWMSYVELMLRSGYLRGEAEVDALRPRRILDSATGLGFVSLEMIRLGLDVTAFDQDLDEALEGVQLPGDTEGRKRYVHANAEDATSLEAICPEGECFDVIMDNHGYFKFARDAFVTTGLTNLLRLLRRGGDLWIAGLSRTRAKLIERIAPEHGLTVLNSDLSMYAYEGQGGATAAAQWAREALAGNVPGLDRAVAREALRFAGRTDGVETPPDASDEVIVKAAISATESAHESGTWTVRLASDAAGQRPR